MTTQSNAITTHPLPTNDEQRACLDWHGQITRLGGEDPRLIAHNRYLTAFGHQHGLCAGLVTHLASTWQQDEVSGRSHVDGYLASLAAAIDQPDAPDARWLDSSLLAWCFAPLAQKFIPCATQTALPLNDILDLLANASAPAAFELSLEQHAMLLAKGQTPEGEYYFLADPNFGCCQLPNRQCLADVLAWQGELTQQLFNPSSVTQAKVAFTLRRFRADLPMQPLFAVHPAGWQTMPTLADLGQLNRLVVRLPQQQRHPERRHTWAQQPVLASALPDTLSEEVMSMLQASAEDMKTITPRQTTSAEDIALKQSVMVQEGTVLSKRLVKSMKATLAGQAHPDVWMPLFDTIEPAPAGGVRISFYNMRDPEAPHLPLASKDADNTWRDTKAVLDKASANTRQRLAAIEAAKARPAPEGTPRHIESPLGDDLAIDGLNAAFLAQTLLRVFSHEKEVNDPSIPKNLAIALQWHDYLNKGMIAVSSAQELVKAGSLIRTLYALSKAENLGKPFEEILERTLPSASMNLMGKAMGLVQLIGFAFDITELAMARTESQRAVYGTSLAFDSANLACLIAGMLGVPGAGQIGVIIAGLGIGIAGLVQAFNQVANRASLVGKHFAAFSHVYATSTETFSAGYEYDSEKKMLSPSNPAVITKLDLAQQRAELTSSFMYPTKHGSTGSGKKNYFFWVGDFPSVQHKRERVINIAQRLGYRVPSTLPSAGRDAQHVVLPNLPQHYIDYGYCTLPGATTRDDFGFNVLRQMEGDDFDFDFYIFPSEYVIDELRFEYVWTPVEVLLGEVNRSLYMPLLAKPMQGQLKYTLRAVRGQFNLSLAYGSFIVLASENPSECTWVLDARQLEHDYTYFHSTMDGRFFVGGVEITVDNPAQSPTILLLGKNGEQSQVNLATKRVEVMEIDASKWTDTNLNNHLAQLRDNHLVLSNIIWIKNYPLPDQKGKTVENAYYDVKNERMLYVTEYPSTTLALIDQQHAYFYNPKRTKLIRINVQTREIDGMYALRDGPALQLWREQGVLFLSPVNATHGKSAIFSLENDRLVLQRVLNDQALMQKLSTQDQLTSVVLTLRKHLEEQYHWEHPSTKTTSAILPTNGLVIVDQYAAKDELSQRYWLRVADGAVIKPKLPAPNSPLNHDFSLVHGHALADGQEAFYFFSQQSKTLYRQVGRGGAQGADATILATPGLVSLSVLNSQLFVHTEQGLIEHVDQDGQLSHFAVTRNWFKDRQHWPAALITLAGDLTLSVLDLKRADDSAQPAWVMKKRLVLAGANLPVNTQLISIETSNDTATAWLLNPQDQALYQQALWTPEQVEQGFGAGTKLLANGNLPQAERKQQFASLLLQGTILVAGLLDGQLPPQMEGITQLMLIPTVPMEFLGINETDWRYYQRLAISVASLPTPTENGQPMVIELALANAMGLYANREDDDLLIFDRASGKSLLILALFAPANRSKVTVRIRDSKTGQIVANQLQEALADADPEIWEMLMNP